MADLENSTEVGEEPTAEAEGAKLEKVEELAPAGEVEETPKTYQQTEVEELIKRQKSDWDVKRQEHEKASGQRYSDLLGKYTSLIETARQQASESFLRKAEESGADPAFAKQLVQLQDELYNRQRELEQREHGITEREGSVETGIKRLAAQELSKRYKVPEAELLKASRPEEMELMALRLALEGKEQETKGSLKTTPAKSTKTTTDWSSLSRDERLKRAIEIEDARRK